MLLSEVCIKRPVLASMMSLGIVLLGLVGLLELPVRELPDIDPPIVNIGTVYKGANSSVVESEVTEKIEAAVNGVQGIKLITSESRGEFSSVTVEFELSRDIDLAAQDVRDRVARVRGSLPDDVEDPVIAKQDSDARPIIWVALFSERHSTLQLTEIGDNILKDPLETVEGVSSVILGGEKRYAIRLKLDSKRMAARGISISDIERALREQSVELPSGRVENLERELSIETLGELKTPREFNNLVVLRKGENLIRLSDVGEALAGVEDQRSIARYNSRPAMGLGIVRQSKANTIAVAEGIKRELEKLSPFIPEGVETFVAYDESVFVKEAIFEVWVTLAISFALVVFIIFLFLQDTRSTFVPAVTIPISVVGTFAIIWMMGFSVNILTMLALVLAIGLVVDDSIVVLENIFRHVEEGKTPLQASFLAMKEIAFAVIATTVAIVAVLLPLTFQKSTTGRLFIEFALSLCGAVILSTFVALTLTPSISARLLKASNSKGPQKGIFAKFESFYKRVSEKYQRMLYWSLDHSKIVVSIAFLSLLLGYVFYKALDSEFLPTEDKGRLFCVAIAPQGATSEYTDRMLKKMEAVMAEQPEVAGYFSAVALPFSGPGKANEGIMFVRMKQERERNTRDMLQGPKGISARFFGGIEGVFAIPIMPKAIGGGFGQSFQLVIQNQDLEKLDQFTEKLVAEMSSWGVMFNVRSTFKLDKPELEVLIDRDRAASLGVSIRDISSTLQILFGGRDVSSFKLKGEQYDVIAQLDRKDRLTPDDINLLYVRNDQGKLVQLSNVLNMQAAAGPNAIFHHSRLRAAVIEGSPTGAPLGEIIQRVEEHLADNLPAGFRYQWKGETLDLKEASQDTFLVIGLAVLVIYMVLAAQFESLIHPFTVMLALPLAVLGAFGGLWLLSLVNNLGQGFYGWANYAPDPPAIASILSSIVPRIPAMTINMFSQIGIVLLLGLVTKNSILLVDFANQAMERGKNAREAMIEAGLIRLRPILMTAFATIAGMLPIAIGFGAGAESRRPMGVAAVGGMLTSTFLTLFVVPVVYVLFDKYFKKTTKRDVVNLSAILILIAPLFFYVGNLRAEEVSKPLTLERSIEIAVNSNTEILREVETLRKQEEKIWEGYSNVLPSVDLRANFNAVDRDLLSSFGEQDFGTDRDWDSRIELEQPLYSGGKSFAYVKEQKLIRDATRLGLRELVNKTVFDVKDKFYSVLLAEANLGVQRSAVHLLEEELRLEKNKFAAGAVSQFNVQRAEVALANKQAPLIKSKNDYKIALYDLYKVLGADSLDRDVEGKLLEFSFTMREQEAVEIARRERPVLKRLQLLIDAAKAGVSFVWSDYLPSLSAKASYGIEKSRFSEDLDDTLDGWRAGIEARWNIFDSFGTSSRLRQAKSELNRARLAYRQSILDVELEVKRAYSAFLESKELLSASLEVVEEAVESNRLAKNRFDVGVATQLDVLNTQVALTEAKSNRVQALYQYNISIARLLWAIGRR